MVQAEMVDKVSSKVSLVQARNWFVSSAEQSVKIIGLKPATSQQHLIKVPVAWKSQGASQLNGKVSAHTMNGNDNYKWTTNKYCSN